jgi:hypothetical protein
MNLKATMRLHTAIKNVILPTDKRLVEVPFGLYRGLRLKINFQTQLQLYLGLNEFETNRAIRSVLHRAKWMVDIGAGHGELSILFKRAGAAVFAVEPLARGGYDIYENLMANSISVDDIRVIEKYIGDIKELEEKWALDGMALDSIPVDRSFFGFIKIDTDGHELNVLRSGLALLANARPALLVETHSVELERDCIALLEELQYRCQIIKNAWFRIIIPEMRHGHNRWLFASP